MSTSSSLGQSCGPRVQYAHWSVGLRLRTRQASRVGYGTLTGILCQPQVLSYFSEMRDVLWTPSRSYARQDDMLRVISDERAEIIDDAAEVSIGTSNDVIFCHVAFEWRQYMRD